MEKKRDREQGGILGGVAELFDLPVDVVAGLPRLELIGNRQLYLERHTGLLAYSDTQIDANQQHCHEIDQQKTGPTAAAHFVREAPDIAQPHRRSECSCQHSECRRKTITLDSCFIHDLTRPNRRKKM